MSMVQCLAMFPWWKNSEIWLYTSIIYEYFFQSISLCALHYSHGFVTMFHLNESIDFCRFMQSSSKTWLQHTVPTTYMSNGKKKKFSQGLRKDAAGCPVQINSLSMVHLPLLTHSQSCPATCIRTWYLEQLQPLDSHEVKLMI